MKRYLVTGLLVWIPLAITIWVLKLLNDAMDASLLLLPASFQPKEVFGRYIPGFGALLTVVVVLLTGMLSANFFGRQLIVFWESLLARIPVVKQLYGGVKQVSDTLFSSKGQAFRKALLVQYPRQGIWTIAFLTGHPGSEVVRHIGEDYLSVYVPTTPNPTSGFFLMVPQQDVIELEMSVDHALKLVISMGVVGQDEGDANHLRPQDKLIS
jgi:uncharacterized membrane protein